MELHHEAYGQGAPLILLHGLLGSADNWHSVCKILAANFKVFALDQRNHGRSPHSFDMNYAILAEDVRQFIQSRGLAQTVVMGHSMGGKTAMQLALSWPAMVGKLLVVDMAPRAYQPRHRQILDAMLSLDPARFQSRKEMETALAPAIPDLFNRQFLLKNVRRDPDGTFHWRIGLQEIARNYPSLAEAITSDRTFEGPALFLRGEQSDYLRPEDFADIQKLFPRALLQTIPSAGHLVHVDQPQAFLKAVVEFLLRA